ncbi:MAG: hypothetical protein EH225_01880 [Calditrichaeota bacterium]|nr:transposase [Calditrichota bacterium]RQW07433.1 MAG: hypothetical protein EH225_01880 [Calditrichota bacterium]
MNSANHCVYVHLIFASKTLLQFEDASEWEALHTSLFDFLNRKGLEPYSVHILPDHLHLLIRLNENTIINELVREVKKNLSITINRTGKLDSKFSWQSGFGAFSVSHSQIGRVREFIRNQENFHESTSFLDEFRQILRNNNIEFEEKDLFREIK